jgi:hypothetical protein
MNDDISAVISNDMRTIGFACDGEACLIGRFKDPIDPADWQAALAYEWERGPGAVARAILRLVDAGHEYEGNFDPVVELNPSEGLYLSPTPLDVD